jgi:NAD dependent epimerase/dehydratase
MNDIGPAARPLRDVNVLVTGADGFIGSHLAARLVAEGARVTTLCLYNSFDHHGWLDDLPRETRRRIDLVRGDVRDAAFVQRIARDQAIIFHLAALIAIPHSYVAVQSYVETNILGTVNVLEAARAAGVGRVVHTSTSEVYGTAQTVPIAECHPLHGQSPYSASKIGADMMAESYVRSFDLPVVTLRPFNTFGPRQSERAVIPTLIRQMLDPACPAITVGDTETRRDFTYVEDTADAFVTAGRATMLEFGRPYNAGSGASITIAELIALLREITGCDKPLRVEAARMRPAASEVRVLQADSSRFFADAGWQPRLGLREGLVRTVAWWRARLAAGLVRHDVTYMT